MGRKQRGFLLFGGVLFLLLVFAGLRTQAGKGGLLAMAAVLGVGLVLVRFHGRLMLLVRRHFQLEAKEALAEDRRRSILFLRSFDHDNEFLVRTGGRVARILGKANVPLEAALIDQVRDFGPVIAIGTPYETLPPLGAARYYAPPRGEKWKDHVELFAEKSQLVVVMLGKAEMQKGPLGKEVEKGLLWEYNLLARSDLLAKTVFVVPLLMGSALKKVLADFLKYAARQGIHIAGRIDSDIVLFAPGGARRLVAVSSPRVRTQNHRLAPSVDYYREPIARILDEASAPLKATPVLGRPVASPIAAGSPAYPEVIPVGAARDRVVAQPARTPYPTAIPVVATHGMRLAEPITEAASEVRRRQAPALFVDWVIAVVVFGLLTLVIRASIDPASTRHAPKSRESEEVFKQGMVIAMMLSPLYFLIMEGLLGISLGKRWFGVRVVAADGGVPTSSQRWLRSLVKTGSMFICLLPFAVLVGFLDRPLHDQLAKTKVVAFRKR